MVEAALLPPVPALESTRPGDGSQGSPWSQFKSRFMKLMIWKKYRRLWSQIFRYKTFAFSVFFLNLLFVFTIEHYSLLYAFFLMLMACWFLVLIRSFVRSFVCLSIKPLLEKAFFNVIRFFLYHFTNFFLLCVTFNSGKIPNKENPGLRPFAKDNVI